MAISRKNPTRSIMYDPVPRGNEPIDDHAPTSPDSPVDTAYLTRQPATSYADEDQRGLSVIDGILLAVGFTVLLAVACVFLYGILKFA